MLNVFLVMLVVLALVALEIKNLLNAVIILGAFSLVLSLIFYYLHAPDVAIAEAAIGSGFTTVIFLLAIKKRGILTMLTYPHSRFFFYNHKGKPAGLDYDILSLFAKKLDVELEVKISKTWQELIPQLLSGNGDIIGAGMTILDSRLKQINFSEGYFPTRVVLVTNTINKDLISQKCLKGQTITVTADTSCYEALKTLKGIQIDSRFSNPNKLIEAVSEEKILIAAVDLPEAIIGQLIYPNITIIDHVSDLQHYGYGVLKDRKELLKKLNVFLTEIKQDGTYEKIYKKYIH